MEPLWGCVAVLLVLIAFVAPVVALVLALRLRVHLRGLRAEVAELRGLAEFLRRRQGSAEPEPAGAAEMGERAPAPAARSAGASHEPAPSGGLEERPGFAPTARPEPEAILPGPELPPADAVSPVRGTPPLPGPVPSEEASSGDGPAESWAPPPDDRPEAAAPAAAGGEPPRPGLEERLGARLPVWLGGIALALAGAFLVKYSVDQGWLSPTVRVALGLVFGVALLGAGELLRGRSFRVSQALSAAGVADLYAVLLAGIRLYELIPPLVGFALMAANTAVAVLLSLRQGVIVALLGLVGGFATPGLVDLGRREPLGLVFYLLLLDLGLLVVTRRRRWPFLAAAALVASLGWAAVWIVGVARGDDGLPVGLFLIASAALFAGVAVRERGESSWVEPPFARLFAAGALGGGLLLLGRLVDASGYGAVEWALFGLLSAGTIALGRLRENDLFALAPFSAAVSFGLLALRGWEVAGEVESRRFLVVLVALGLVHALGGWLVALSSAVSGRWSVLSAASLVAFPLLGYFSTRDELDLPWAWLALGVGALAVGLLTPFALGRDRRSGAEVALAAFAVAATLAVSLALPLALERSWLSVALAVEAPLLLALRDRLRVPALARLAEIAGSIAAVRLVANPEVLGYPVSATPVLNDYLWAYGLPIAAFLAAAALARRQGSSGAALGFDAGASLFAFALVSIEVWHFFDDGVPLAPFRDWGLAEWSSQALAWLLVGLLLIELGRRLGRRAFSVAGRIGVIAAGLQALVVHGLFENPAWVHNPVGGAAVANLLLAAFGVPALLLLFAAWRVEAEGGRRLPGAARLAALLLLFANFTLEVRRFFRGSDLAEGAVTNAEQFAYSALWAAMGMALLGVGLGRRSKRVRFAALSVMALVAVKVFVLDTSELQGLYRVLSFAGLGVSLLLLAHLYQRFVLREEAK